MQSNKPWEQVKSPIYFERVLKNMERIRDPQRRRVRFGTLGEGVAPNYQIEELGTGRKVNFYGLTHRPYLQREVFDEAHLSDQFTPDAVSELKAACQSRS